MPPSAPGASSPQIGASVRLNGPLPYLKTADPMPMLRPPDLVDPEEIGVVVEQRARDQLAVRFRRGTFLLSASALQIALNSQGGEHSGDGGSRPAPRLEGLGRVPPG